MEGVIIGFDEYMNIVLDDAVEINTNSKQQQKRINVGRCLLKGDAITLIQLRISVLFIYVFTMYICLYTYILAYLPINSLLPYNVHSEPFQMSLYLTSYSNRNAQPGQRPNDE
jgi:small nuclear ribonucleoprotein E